MELRKALALNDTLVSRLRSNLSSVSEAEECEFLSTPFHPLATRTSSCCACMGALKCDLVHVGTAAHSLFCAASYSLPTLSVNPKHFKWKRIMEITALP